jgi:hypothetical protein
MTTVKLSERTTAFNCKFQLELFLAAKADAKFNYVTFSLRRAAQNGMFGLSRHKLWIVKHFNKGGFFLLQLGQVFVAAKINRAGLETAAFHCPRTIKIPRWQEDSNTGKSSIIVVDAVNLGYTGLEIDYGAELKSNVRAIMTGKYLMDRPEVPRPPLLNELGKRTAAAAETLQLSAFDVGQKLADMGITRTTQLLDDERFFVFEDFRNQFNNEKCSYTSMALLRKAYYQLRGKFTV